jgi:ElaB/YqjD/DUF883 family membrane-anchored ribosome-binding protein
MESGMTDGTTYTQGNRTKTGGEKNAFLKDAEDKAADMVHSVEHSASVALERGKEFAEDAGTRAKAAGEMVVTRIKDYPLSAVGIAFGVGILFALLRK